MTGAVVESRPEPVSGKEVDMLGLEKIFPYTIATLGVVSDFASTQLGLIRGFREANVLYGPIPALVVFWTILTVATLALPRGTLRRTCVFAIVCLSFVGLFNNIFVMAGIFGISG
ncbi:hypothetical protein MUP77_01750 [Candidatus Bathyarchaeota archaeon]|nr:hypothetical protein [Candidatus Bathyarchaeota archaeon]